MKIVDECKVAIMCMLNWTLIELNFRSFRTVQQQWFVGKALLLPDFELKYNTNCLATLNAFAIS